MHGFHHLHHVVLTFGVAHVKLREMGHIQSIGQRGHLIGVLHARKGHKGCAGAGAANKVRHGPLCRIFLRSLREMRQRVGGLHAVFQDELADFNGGKQMGVCVCHRVSSCFGDYCGYPYTMYYIECAV